MRQPQGRKNKPRGLVQCIVGAVSIAQVSGARSSRSFAKWARKCDCDSESITLIAQLPVELRPRDFNILP
jgi:hypothetical protein